MARPFNFSPGPATIPEAVLRQAAAELLDWNGRGVSVMEMSHRGADFMSIQADAQASLRRLLAIPKNYQVLFLQGGAIGQNAIVAMNLLRGKRRADYVDTGAWSTRSITAASRFCEVNVAASGRDSGYTAIPKPSQWRLDPGAAYVHICANETIGGVEFHWTPDTGEVPLVADMSSNILSKPIEVSRYGLVYGGAQKNVGPAGLTFVIVRDDLIGGASETTPEVFDYAVQAANDSMINTPPTWSIYVSGLVFKWLEDQGGLAAIEFANRAKAALLYEAIDASALYENRVAADDRSRMNVVFHLRDKALEQPFLDGAKAAGLLALKGHRLVGGMRASIYNAMPIEGVRALVAYMKAFEARHG